VRLPPAGGASTPRPITLHSPGDASEPRPITLHSTDGATESRPITLRDLHPLDIVVVRDLVRFGILTNDQIDRRYGNPLITAQQLPLLVTGGFVEPWRQLIKGAAVYSASASGARIARTGLKASRPTYDHLRHDIAVVDLADYLLAHEIDAEWRTEREASRVLRTEIPLTRRRGAPKGPGHRPDGLLLVGGKRLAIELEHSDKGDYRYARICRWFALNLRLDGLRWYVDDEKIIARLRRVNAEHGFTHDIDVTYELFPPGVVIRQWDRP
jgi:hypothetical protein